MNTKNKNNKLKTQGKTIVEELDRGEGDNEMETPTQVKIMHSIKINNLMA